MSDAASNPAAETLLGEKEATTSDVKHSENNSNADNRQPTTDNGAQARAPGRSEAELIEEMKSFDNLLKMLSVYRDNPDLRGNPNDRHIEEIAKILSNFIDDDPDNFFRSSDEDEKVESGMNVDCTAKKE